jgi:hypothetical protein
MQQRTLVEPRCLFFFWPSDLTCWQPMCDVGTLAEESRATFLLVHLLPHSHVDPTSVSRSGAFLMLLYLDDSRGPRVAVAFIITPSLLPL